MEEGIIITIHSKHGKSTATSTVEKHALWLWKIHGDNSRGKGGDIGLQNDSSSSPCPVIYMLWQRELISASHVVLCFAPSPSLLAWKKASSSPFTVSMANSLQQASWKNMRYGYGKSTVTRAVEKEEKLAFRMTLQARHVQ
jgi:hypothetical protein